MKSCRSSEGMARSAREWIEAIRAQMIASVCDLPSDIDPVQSLFLIGSCSDPNVPEDWYQDYDVHFRFRPVQLRRESLDWLRALLSGLTSQSGNNAKIEAFVRDRHWKMVPDRRFAVNVGIHATLMNAADHFRRVHLNPILAYNMYTRCLVLHGEHPRNSFGARPVSAADYAHNVGGLGWLSENLARAATLHVIMPEDRSFYPFIAGYCWNIASSLMFHLVTLECGEIASRSNAFRHFITLDGLDPKVAEAADLLYAYRETPDAELPSPRTHFNATGRILDFVYRRFLAFFPHDLGHTSATARAGEIMHHAPLYPQACGLIFGQSNDLIVVDYAKKYDPDDYYGTIEEAAEVLCREFGEGISIKENFEFLRDWLRGDERRVRVRVWDRTSVARRILSHDYDLTRGVYSEAGIVFGWEDGIQALLQRLYEVYLEKGCEDEELAKLSSLAVAIGLEHLAAYDSDRRVAYVHDFETASSRLSNILTPFLPLTPTEI